MTVKKNLIAAKLLIDTPEKWGRGGGSYMPDHGKPLCILGACLRARAEDGAVEALRDHLPSRFNRRFIHFNDHHDTTHADIMALFDRAIEDCED